MTSRYLTPEEWATIIVCGVLALMVLSAIVSAIVSAVVTRGGRRG